MENLTMDLNAKKQKIIQMTSFMVHKHYSDNDSEALIRLFDDQISWFGAGENEYETDTEAVAKVFRDFAGMIPRCNISDEEYEVMAVTPEIFVCTGRMWISTDPSVNMFLKVHQRITTVFRWQSEEPKCCHIHISNPYFEMQEQEVGFPAAMGKHSYEYLQKCIDEQKRKIEKQTEELRRMSFEDSLTGLYNRYKFNEKIKECQEKQIAQLGVAYFDLNGLKRVNDLRGHSAGDALIRRAAVHISRFFKEKAYRIGGDEFVIIDEIPDEKTFYSAVESICRNMKQDGIAVSVGISWRCSECDVWTQVEEADELMLEDKRNFYKDRKNDRRKNRD